ncbi:hypothetical protein HPB48_008905 [Haemaphysalis longicornis]|uniref:Cytochrome P450 n=1 Tax=Haemaphysalis longicornis TaxID=44386 RepID=A0A9J6FQU2_HAELO|nr:hypothetical protein HPB48_008905 [Haemaphysalis longicornis]
MGALAFDMVAETACGLTLDVQHKHTDGYFDSARNMMFNVIESVFQKAGRVSAWSCMHHMKIKSVKVCEARENTRAHTNFNVRRFTTRRASRDYHYKDMVIPKGVSIMACMHQIHKDPNLWDRPDEFDPERFSPEKKASRDPLAFQPYGIGPRNCVGLRVAQLEITLIVARLVHRFRLHLGSQHADVRTTRHTNWSTRHFV